MHTTVESINFEYKDISFECPVLGTYTILGGEASTGKTFFFNAFQDYLNITEKPKSEQPFNGQVDFMFSNTKWAYIEKIVFDGSPNKLVCIDNAEHLFSTFSGKHESKSLLRLIRENEQYCYIIATRHNWGFDASAWNILVPHFDGKKITFCQEEDI